MVINIYKVRDRIAESKTLEPAEIFVFLIDAVHNFPIRDLEDTTEYFEAVERLVGPITIENLDSYLASNQDPETDIEVWTRESISSLYEALVLIHTSGLQFSDVRDRIDFLDFGE